MEWLAQKVALTCMTCSDKILVPVQLKGQEPEF